MGEIALFIGAIIGAGGTGWSIYIVFTDARFSATEYTFSFFLYGVFPIAAGYVIRGLLAHNWGFTSQTSS